VHAGGGAQRGARKVRDDHRDPGIKGSEKFLGDGSRVAEIDRRWHLDDLLPAIRQCTLIRHDRPLRVAEQRRAARNGSAMISSVRSKIIATTR
jgi:hypothetical protein